MGGCVALVVAAGRGERLGAEVPKQYLDLGGAPLLGRAVRAFTRHPRVNRVRCVIRPEDRPLYDRATAGLALLEPVSGGANRQESVRLGLESLVALDPAMVLIHDGARPFVDADVVGRALDALTRSAGAVPAIPVSDTLKRARDGWVEATVERAGLWRAQTPQAFRYGDILAAHRAAAGLALGDDAQVAEQAGLVVATVAGSEDNIKVTTPDDLVRARARLAGGEVRTGLGWDTHRFAPGDHVMLCGVRIPFDRGLTGHSDADVGLHALTDALLGAIGAGDIGIHFPPGEPRWRGEPSETFVRHAGGLVAERGGSVVNVDLTLICERPRIAPHRPAMVARMGAMLGLATERVSVKGTTTEGLGFTGRGEGIAAQAVATVRIAV